MLLSDKYADIGTKVHLPLCKASLEELLYGHWGLIVELAQQELVGLFDKAHVILCKELKAILTDESSY